jgi:Leucine rich repeat variant.
MQKRCGKDQKSVHTLTIMEEIELERRASSHDTEPEVLEELSRSISWRVRRAVGWNPSTPVAVLKVLSRDRVQWVREAVAGNPKTPLDVLEALARDPDGYVRSAVALNTATPDSLLSELSEDEMVEFDATNERLRYIVMEAVAKNPRTPEHDIIRLSASQSDDVRAAVASNPKVPVYITEKLSRDQSWLVRFRVARNPVTPPEVLGRLADDRITDVRVAVAANVKSPPDSLISLSKDRMIEVRCAVAENPSTPVEALEALAGHLVFFGERGSRKEQIHANIHNEDAQQRSGPERPEGSERASEGSHCVNMHRMQHVCAHTTSTHFQNRDAIDCSSDPAM